MTALTSDRLTGETTTRRWRSLVVVVAVVLGVSEIAAAFSITEPASAVVYGLVVLGLAWWTARSRRRIPVVLLVVLAALELLAVLAVYGGWDAFTAPSADYGATVKYAYFALITLLTAASGLLALSERTRRP
jgi:hypothetical protein